MGDTRERGGRKRRYEEDMVRRGVISRDLTPCTQGPRSKWGRFEDRRGGEGVSAVIPPGCYLSPSTGPGPPRGTLDLQWTGEITR